MIGLLGPQVYLALLGHIVPHAFSGPAFALAEVLLQVIRQFTQLRFPQAYPEMLQQHLCAAMLG